MEREFRVLSATVERPARPLVAMLGGTRLREKVDVVRRFFELADAVCIGGAMCFPFLCRAGTHPRVLPRSEGGCRVPRGRSPR